MFEGIGEELEVVDRELGGCAGGVGFAYVIDWLKEMEKFSF
jgi:hypothetical protein